LTSDAAIGAQVHGVNAEAGDPTGDGRCITVSINGRFSVGFHIEGVI
jgi:hypothetical protein